MLKVRTLPSLQFVYVFTCLHHSLTWIRIWSQTLGIPPPEPDDDFFFLGGDSLSALAVVKGLVEWDGMYAHAIFICHPHHSNLICSPFSPGGGSALLWFVRQVRVLLYIRALNETLFSLENICFLRIFAFVLACLYLVTECEDQCYCHLSWHASMHSREILFI